MKRFARLLLVTVGFGALGFVMSLAPQKNATGAGGAPVNIISSVPLSVTGSVNAAQSGNWNVGITGTPNVSVSNFPAVQQISFGNTNTTPLFVQDVENPGRNGFQVGSLCSFQDGVCQISPIYTIPAGKIAIFEYGSGRCFIDSGTAIADIFVDTFDLSTHLGTQFDLVPGLPVSVNRGGIAAAEVSFGHLVRAYAVGGQLGSSVTVFVEANGSLTGGESCAVSLAGYTVSQ